MSQERVQAIFQQLYHRYPQLSTCRASIRAAFDTLVGCFRQNGILYTCGNGGTASDAQHITGELMKAFVLQRPLPLPHQDRLCGLDPELGGFLAQQLHRALPAVTLGSETALSTAIANDMSGELVFAQQVYALGRRGDTLLALTTSGNSRNVLLAATAAHARGMKVIGMTGMAGGTIGGRSDVLIALPETETYRVQELGLPVYHALCMALEVKFFG